MDAKTSTDQPGVTASILCKSMMTAQVPQKQVFFIHLHLVLTTPPSASRLTGIAETCPGATFKHVKKSRNVDLGLCRRLAFDL
ncbi:hypothetical protein CTI12_AA038360 [Artemisia annua]|uniref:Uncharacterized protein n=1 Tax=Artemisia annua TaxID=35608 RepID=A0A2U1QF70_ARTAN|nr:hypothetical protein CTI12_AA038360 [Artemisia annua]